MYCEKLLKVKNNKDSSKFLIDSLIIHKLDDYLKNYITLRERRNINPVKFAIEKQIQYKTAMMLFVIGSRESLFRMRLFFECNCGEHIELETTKDKIMCECGLIGEYQELKDSIKLYFELLEKPVKCEWDVDINGETDFLNEFDIAKYDNSFSSIEKVGDPGLIKSIDSLCLLNIRNDTMKEYLDSEGF